MDAEDKRLLLSIHEKVSGIKPILDAHSLELRGIDARTRGLEIEQGAHDVKILRLQDDLDGVGRKLRAVGSSRPFFVERTPWLSFLTFAAEHWHILTLTGGTFATAVIVLWRHWPK